MGSILLQVPYDAVRNTDLIALNQDTLGHSAVIVQEPHGISPRCRRPRRFVRLKLSSDRADRRQTPVTREQQVLVKNLANATSPRAVALFNRGERRVTMNVSRTELGLPAACGCASLRDETKKVAVERNCVRGGGAVASAPVLPHQAVVLRATCVR
eukprot:COSAG04_NODE_834_length_9992_cov_54.919786_6_plen_156_part_00